MCSNTAATSIKTGLPIFVTHHIHFTQTIKRFYSEDLYQNIANLMFDAPDHAY